MASHHHHHQQQQQNSHHHGHQHHSTTTTCCCCYCPPSSCSCFTPTLICPPPPVASVTTATDPLLHTIALHLLQSTTPPLTQPQHFFSPTPPHQHQYYKTQVEEDPHQQTHLINSLLQRISALEVSSLNSPSRPLNPTTHVSPQQSTLQKEATRKTTAKGGYVPVRVSLRDVAARTIQTQFRLYLVHRSQTLRHLKQLSIIRSHVGDLGSLNPRSVSDRVMDLLLRLDNIQSRDPMIREGKRSLGNELMRILDMAKMESLQQKKRLQTSSSEPVVMRSVSQISSSDDVEEDDEAAEVEEVFVGGEEAEGKKMNDGIEVTAGVRYGLDSSSSSSSSPSNGRHMKNGNPHLGLFAPLPVKMEYHRKGELS